MISNELKDFYELIIAKINTNASQFKLTIIELIRRKYLNVDDNYDYDQFYHY